jgi:uncharacterized membrane protein
MLVWAGLLLVLVGAALMYPVLAFSARTNNFGWRPDVSPAGGGILSAAGAPLTLDGTAYMADDSPQDPADCRTVGAGSNHADNFAIDWLNRNVSGSPIILEAPGCEWTRYSRISAFTGLPTLLGWPGGHEGEWRATWLAQQPGDVFGERTNAINAIYTSVDEHTVMALLHAYHVRYVYVGAAERNLYPTADLTRFGTFLRTVYQRDGVTIYAVP